MGEGHLAKPSTMLRPLKSFPTALAAAGKRRALVGVSSDLLEQQKKGFR